MTTPTSASDGAAAHPPSTQRRLFGYLSHQFAGTMTSRAMGFVRELVTSFYFGVSSAADAFVVALTIPTLFRDVLGEDVVERSFMPGVREELARKNYDRAWRLSSASLTWMILGITATMALVYLAAPWLVNIVAQGIHQRQIDEGTLGDIVRMTRLLVPFIMFIALGAYLGGLLYYGYDLHLPFSLAPAMLSVGVIASLVLLTESIGVYALAVGFVAGAALQLLVQVPFLWIRRVRETRPRYRPTLIPPKGTGRRISRETAWVTLQSVLTKTTEIVDRRVASFLATGSISSLWFSARLVQLPLAIIGIAIGRAVSPYLSEKIAVGDRAEVRNAVLIGYRYNLLLILPVTGLCIALAEPIVRLIFERGEFGAHDTAMTARAFWCYATGLLGMSLYSLGSRVCSTLGRNRVATFTAAIGGGVNIWLNYVLSATALRHGGLALATSIGFTINSALLFTWLHLHLRADAAGFTAREVLAPAARAALNTAAATAVAYALHGQLASTASDGFVSALVTAGLPLAAGLGVYALVSILNPLPEVMPVVRRLRELLHR